MEEKPLDNILIFEPQYKSVIWGGDRISELKGEYLGEEHIGESWEISPLSGHESIVAEGPHKGMSISELSDMYGRELLGNNVVRKYGNKFPLLIKLLDAHDILSLQVHPNDEVAQKYHASQGKSEMWYVIDAGKDAQIYCGLSKRLTPETFDIHVNDKTIMNMVASYHSQPGQFYYLPAGTIHTIGAGNLIAEIQQASDITYRVYDHNRTNSDGHPRDLHIDLARAALDYSFPNETTPTAHQFENSTCGVVINEHFTVDYYKVDTSSIDIYPDKGSFTAMLVTKGVVNITADGEMRSVKAGHTVLIPASVGHIELSGNGIVLATHV